MRERFLLTHLGVVSALGVSVAENESRLFAGDTSGMRCLDNLAGGERTLFGFAPLGDNEFNAAPTRIAALVDAAMSQLEAPLEELRLKVPSSRIGAVIGTSNSTMEEFTDNPEGKMGDRRSRVVRFHRLFIER